jgi:hypothetical protein
MKRALGSLACVGLIIAAVGLSGHGNAVFAQRAIPAAPSPPPTPAPAVAAGNELIVVSASAGDKGQILTVVDPRQKTICVYRIEFATGRIALQSVRNISWDMQLGEAGYNTDKPTPTEIRSMSEPK